MTLPISGDLHPSDPVSRKRQPVTGGRGGDKVPPPAAAGRPDQAAILSSSPEAVKSYVQTLKAMNPVDLHRIEELRERIRSGEYQADPDEMAAPLADFLARSRSGHRGA